MWRISSMALLVFALAFPAHAQFGSWNPVGDVAKAVGDGLKKGGEAVQQVGQVAAEGVKHVTNEAGKASTTLGQNLQSNLGGDGAKVVGDVFVKAGETTKNVGAATATFATTGVANPAGEFVVSLGKTSDDLSRIDIRHPETIGDVVRQAAGAGIGVVSSAERTAERTAQDISSLAVSVLPAPVEKGIRHASGEVIKELEKKNPELAQLLRRLPTSIIYNHLRNLAGDEMGCDPQSIFAKLDTAPRKGLDGAARWTTIATTPLKAAGMSGWTVTGCRGTALGVLTNEPDTSSGDNFITLDLRLVALSVGGQSGDVSGRFLRVEVLPIGRAHSFALYHRFRIGDTVLTSGMVVQDEDAPPITNGPFFEIHPVDDLEVVATATTSDHPPLATTPDHLVAPLRDGDAARFAYHEVQLGESLSTIAAKFYGVQHWPTLYEANRAIVRDPDVIEPGWRLNVPIKLTRGVAATAAAVSSKSIVTN